VRTAGLEPLEPTLAYADGTGCSAWLIASLT